MTHLTRSLWLAATLALSLLAVTQNAAAMTLDIESGDQLDFADELLDDGDQAISGPLVVTFSDIVTSDGLPGGQIDTDGIFFGRDPIDFAVVSMAMTFNLPTIFAAYDIDFFFTLGTPSSAGTFQIEGPGGTSTAAMTLFPDPSAPARLPFDMGTIGVFQPGIDYRFVHDLTGLDLSQIDEFDFRIAAVPLPAGGVLLVAGLLGLGLLRRRVGTA